MARLMDIGKPPRGPNIKIPTFAITPAVVYSITSYGEVLLKSRELIG